MAETPPDSGRLIREEVESQVGLGAQLRKGICLPSGFGIHLLGLEATEREG
uniref:Uncharacterized protein n=1 Tax=Cucumis melo TaxID=3656 RepID=A0A9I9CC73_CUCME